MKKKEFGIRRMRRRDLDEVVSIEADSSVTPWSRQMFIDEMGHPYGACFVMTSMEASGASVIGFICFRNIGEESELLNLCLRPDRRRAGLGRELMQFYTAYSLTRGIKTFHLEVDPANRSAIELYRIFAYRPVAVRPRYYRGTTDALRMMKGM